MRFFFRLLLTFLPFSAIAAPADHFFDKDPRGRDTTEKAYAQSPKIRATPNFIFYDLGGAEIVRIAGPLQSAEEFLLLGHFVASGAYKSRTVAQFELEQPTRKGS